MILNQVTLPAVDLRASIDFYKRLGLQQIVDSPHYSRFECPQGDATFSLHRVPPPFSPHPDYTIYFEIDRLDEFVARRVAEGMVFDRLPEDMPWKWREARLRDPAGNVICLYRAGDFRKYPPWRIEPPPGRGQR